MKHEPLIHSHRADGLPIKHELASKDVGCARCGVLVHAFNNECMQTWVETKTRKPLLDVFSRNRPRRRS
jgi:hypothetical protein